MATRKIPAAALRPPGRQAYHPDCRNMESAGAAQANYRGISRMNGKQFCPQSPMAESRFASGLLHFTPFHSTRLFGSAYA